MGGQGLGQETCSDIALVCWGRCAKCAKGWVFEEGVAGSPSAASQGARDTRHIDHDMKSSYNVKSNPCRCTPWGPWGRK